jgi:hypothetical protein
MEGLAERHVNSVIVGEIIRRFTKRRVLTSMSVAMHLSHGAALGVLFLMILDFLRTPMLRPMLRVYAIAYSVLLWIVSPYLTRNLFASLGRFRITGKGLVVSFLGHLIYGILLGLVVSIFV